MEHFVQAAVLHAPVPNQLRVGGTQVNLLIGQFQESSVLFWTNAVGAKLVERGVLLLRTRGEVPTRLETGGETASVSSGSSHFKPTNHAGDVCGPRPKINPNTKHNLVNLKPSGVS